MPGKPGGRNRRKPEPYDFAEFRGYRGPRFTPVPDEFLDHQLADLSSSEAKVMLFLFRKTYGYRKSADRISLAQLERGTMSAQRGIIDRGTGLSRATIWRALKGLQKKGLIEVHRQTTAAGDSDVNYYRIREDAGPTDANAGHRSDGSNVPGGGERSESSDGGGGEVSNAHNPSGKGGLFSPATTPSSKLNHPGLRTEPGGDFISKPTRTKYTRENLTLSHHLDQLAMGFLKSIGYAKPAKPKRERTSRILNSLAEEDGYTLDELAAACEIAASLGARGPELIPHVAGRASQPHAKSNLGESISRHQDQERRRWQSLSAQFDQLSEDEQQGLIQQACASSDILAKRAVDHPLVRAAAIALLDEE